MRVAFFPYGTAQENPYQQLLIEGLAANGVEVDKIPGRKFFPLLPVIRSKADVIHIFWPHDLYIGRNILTAILKAIMLRLSLPLLRNKILVYSAENVAGHMHGTDYAVNELRWIQRILDRCRGIIFMNPVAPDIFKAYYQRLPEQSLIIPHVHFCSVYPDTISSAEARKELQLPTDATVFLVLGRIAPYKGIEETIQAFMQLPHPEARLIIAGRSTDTGYLQQLRQFANQDTRIQLHDRFIHNNEVQVYFNAANASIFNYQDIPLNPGSVIMAKGFGVRIIAPMTPTLQALDQGDCILYPSGQMLTALRQIANTRPLPAKANIAKHLALHAPEKVGAQLTSFYKQLKA